MIVDLQVDLETAEGGLVDAAELVAGAKAAGLDAVLLTHGANLGVDLSPYREAAAEHGLTVFRGAKVESDHGLILCIVPNNAPELGDDWAEKVDGLYDAHAVIDAIEGYGGVSVALRPYDRDVAHPMGDHLFALQGLAACEVMTGGLSDIANDLALEAASNMEMPCIGTSGGHGLAGLGTVATLLRTAAKDETELCDALRAGDCWPLTFSENVPRAQPQEEREGRSGRGRGRGRGGERGAGERSGPSRERGPKPEGGRREGGRAGGAEGGREGGRGRGRGGRSRAGGAEGERPGDDRGNRRRGGRGRGGAGGGRPQGPKPDDIGNRVPRTKREMPEDAGNIIRAEVEAPVLPEDIGNRLRRGQSSPYRRDPDAQPEFIPNDIDDSVGNR